jgi:predicted glycoside hydrolase/deacetylase ChbG (UPF0249 family)
VKPSLPISINALVNTFNCPRKRPKLAIGHGLELLGNRAQNNGLDRDRERQILDWIRKNAESMTPVTKQEIKHSCTSQFQTPIIRGWVNSFVLCYAGDIIRMKSARQEEQRSQVL